MKKNRILLSLFIPLMLIGCANASGTYLITGTQREALGAESVVIYTEFPADRIRVTLAPVGFRAWIILKSMKLYLTGFSFATACRAN